MTVSTTYINVNFCIVTVVLCKLLIFELASYIELHNCHVTCKKKVLTLKLPYTPIKPSFSRVTTSGCAIPPTIDSLLARRICGIVFACVRVLAMKPPFSQLCLHCASPAG